ncbi:hypothetical protein Sulku_1330 [Sulfuricurvum kujiense DSM 16994]|uniref:Uncharacterized protein n=1 Tax=Sulfuricurvum kujiense (strain ATCC BAA-921 / DSM 16994 / JCM 11577 / YK-1) TaxID=709032 RepID=E4TY73_SULKY|nr:hypothetical protein Sulku_1330 [Sulfuricurvum kujiense DSM 16994]
MTALSSVVLRLMGEQYTLPTPYSSLICDLFVHNGFSYCRTPTKWLMRPVHGRLWKKISRSTFEFEHSAYKTKINQSQAKGLLKYTQLEFDL